MLRIIAFGLALSLAPIHAAAQAPAAPEEAAPDLLESRAADVVAVLQGEVPAAGVFAPSFLEAVPEAQLATIVTQIEAQFGPLEGLDEVTPAGPRRAIIRLKFARAHVGGPMVLSADGMVTGLQLNDFQPLGDSAEAIVADLAKLPGEVSVLYAPLDRWKEPIVALNPDEELAIGSAFKLYVLSALAHQIASGEHSWDEVVELDTRSLPSGILQDWPRGAPMTLHTLAALMISISDNTAADQLIHLLGRDAIAAEVRASGHSDPARILPFLTTLELFGYKGDPTRAGFYAMAGEEQQAALLKSFAQEIARDPDNITPPRFTQPTMIDTIEWFAGAADIRRLMERIAALNDPTAREIMAISPAVPEPKRGSWSYIGYKGGSEPGVLNLSWLLQSPAGDWYVLAMSWNNPEAPVDQAQFELFAQRLLSLPR